MTKSPAGCGRKRLDERRFLERYIEIRAALTVDVS